MSESFPFLISLEALTICFASCGVVLFLALYFILRSSPTREERIAAIEPAEKREPIPRELDALRMEGFEVLEVYEEPNVDAFDPTNGFASIDQIVRLAKVRNPETGEVSLMRVRVTVRPWN